jgi:drug/metabolite transporter (DMT)-like permease
MNPALNQKKTAQADGRDGSAGASPSRPSADSVSLRSSAIDSRPATWKLVLAFAVVYLSWGTTYFAIRAGVHTEKLPPALFGGVRVGLAGWLLLAFLAWRGIRLRMPRGELFWVILSGLLLFVGGNGLITFALDNVPSGVTAVLVAATPLWMALMELAWPGGDRLSGRGWLGLGVGLAGVVLLLGPELLQSQDFESLAGLFQRAGPLWVIGSSLFWAFGSLLLRYCHRTGPRLASAAYQMIVGGMATALLGVALGETSQLSPAQLTWGAGFSFFYLLIVGSLMGFVAFNWLLGHVPATMVGTYAYVNPLVAVLVGWLLGGEEMTVGIVAGLVVILAGVALVRSGGVQVGKRDSLELADGQGKCGHSLLVPKLQFGNEKGEANRK